MSRTFVPAHSSLTRRRCCRCGYDGPETQSLEHFICPSCGQDLYARPPMSYLEMEGFVRPRQVAAEPGRLARVARLVRRVARRAFGRSRS